MSVDYNGVHSIDFYKKIGTAVAHRNSWEHFHLIPEPRPYIEEPKPNYHIVNIPGTNKRYDITHYLPGQLTFGPRSGSWTFHIDHDQWSGWQDAYNTISSFLHGSEIVLSLSDNSEIYYNGVLTVQDYSPGSSYSKISIHYDLDYETGNVKVRQKADGSYEIISYSPVKFIAESGTAYYNDYGIQSGASYITANQDSTRHVTLYDLTVLNS